jgi:hypothetical protein
MNDDFLNGFRESPRPEFARSLYGKLSRERQFARFRSRRAQTMRVVARVLAAVVLALGLTILVLPDVRVALTQFIQNIAGFAYKETEQISPPKDGTPIEPDKISLSEVQALLPQLTFGVPSWSPAGYILQEEVHFYGDFIMLNWVSEKTRSYGISLLIGSAAHLSSDLIETGPGPQEVLIRSTPALLERGGYDEETGKWSSEVGMALRWKRDDTYYLLMTDGSDVNPDDLIRMAESIP